MADSTDRMTAEETERTWQEELWWIASQAHSSAVAVAARITGAVYHDNMDLRLCNGDSCKRFVALELALDSQVRNGEALAEAGSHAPSCQWWQGDGQPDLCSCGWRQALAAWREVNG